MDSTFASDLKLSNILAGIGNHASAYGCLYCHQKTSGIGAFVENEQAVTMRTIGTLKKCNSDFMEIGQGKKENAKNFFSCINPPILKGEANIEIIQLVPPPGTY